MGVQAYKGVNKHPGIKTIIIKSGLGKTHRRFSALQVFNPGEQIFSKGSE